MSKTLLIILFVSFFGLLFYGFIKIDRKLEALVRRNNKEIKKNGKKIQ